MISQVFVVSSRGDTILFRDYRCDIPSNTPERFFKHLISFPTSPPFFELNGIHFTFIEQSTVYFVCTTTVNISPSLAVSFLSKFYALIKDFCGVANEESIRANFGLIYEIADEIMDFGYIQSCATAELKPHIFNEVVAVEATDDWILSDVLKFKTKSSKSTTRPIAISVQDDRNQKNEIFVDLIEKLTVTINTVGEVVRNDITGKLIMKSYLKGDPEVQLGLSNDLVIRNRASTLPNRDCPIIDDITFHPCINQETFDRDRSIHFQPANGEIQLLSYRLADSFSPPFRCYVNVNQISSKMADLIIKLQPTFSSDHHSANTAVHFTVPKAIQSVSFSLSSSEDNKQEAHFQRQHSKVVWHIDQVNGGEEQVITVKMNWDDPTAIRDLRQEIGSLLLDFEIPMYLCSSLAIRHLRILERSEEYNPDRWVRYLTQSHSYRIRI